MGYSRVLDVSFSFIEANEANGTPLTREDRIAPPKRRLTFIPPS